MGQKRCYRQQRLAFDLNARILKSVVDQLGIDKVHLLGNSMGGHSAVAFTLSWPERVAKLVLMGGGPAA